jgi:hypothetical protein
MTTDLTTNDTNDEAQQHEFGERTSPRVVIDEMTGYPAVTKRPGAPMITNEDVKRMLEDFP